MLIFVIRQKDNQENVVDKRRVQALALVVVLVCGCAAVPEPPPRYEVADADRFAPINLDVYAGEYVSRSTQEVVSVITQSMTESGRFAHVQMGRERWPFSVQVTYGFTQTYGVVEFLASMVSAASLLIIPAPLPERHLYRFEVLYGPSLLASYEYSEDIKNKLWLFNVNNQVRKDAAIRVIKQFIADLERDTVLPTGRDVEDVNPPRRGA